MTETMTIHQALIELKLLSARITKEIDSTVFIGRKKHSSTKVNNIEVTDFKENIVSKYQSIMDLIKRRDAIKRAVVISNATTKVDIDGQEYTIAEAIDAKNASMQFMRSLASKLALDKDIITKETNYANNDIEDRAEKHIQSLFGSKETKNDKSIKEAYDNFIESQTMELVDPLMIDKKITAIEEKYQKFLTAFDSAISVSNATTNITVEY